MFNKRTYDFQPKRACSIITIGSFKKQHNKQRQQLPLLKCLFHGVAFAG